MSATICRKSGLRLVLTVIRSLLRSSLGAAEFLGGFLGFFGLGFGGGFGLAGFGGRRRRQCQLLKTGINAACEKSCPIGIIFEAGELQNSSKSIDDLSF